MCRSPRRKCLFFGASAPPPLLSLFAQPCSLNSFATADGVHRPTRRRVGCHGLARSAMARYPQRPLAAAACCRYRHGFRSPTGSRLIRGRIPHGVFIAKRTTIFGKTSRRSLRILGRRSVQKCLLTATIHRPYNSAKAAVRHLAASLAVEWAHANIRVNCISPGYMLTAL